MCFEEGLKRSRHVANAKRRGEGVTVRLGDFGAGVASRPSRNNKSKLPAGDGGDNERAELIEDDPESKAVKDFLGDATRRNFLTGD